MEQYQFQMSTNFSLAQLGSSSLWNFLILFRSLFPNIIYLDLHNNQLNGTISDSFNNMSKVTALLLYNMFDSWSSLQYLMIQNNMFPNVFPKI